MDKFRYRIITNLQCNNRCSFCYQKYKPDVGADSILPIERLNHVVSKVKNANGKLSRATIMGGESLLLSNICEYVKIAKDSADTVCLVTNGRLLTEDLLINLSNSGLDEIAISIYSIQNFNTMLDKIILADKYIKNMRINIPRCEESSGEKLRILVKTCLDNDFGCVVCEDLMGRYGDPHYDVISKWDNVAELINEHNFVTYIDLDSNKRFGLFAHYSGYDNTDVIVTPLGNFGSWEKYCNKIDNYELR